MKRDFVAECLPEQDHFMAPAWLGLIRFAATRPDIVADFEKDSGMVFRFPASGIEKMIDQTTGYQEDLIFKFAHWITKNLWGDSTRQPREPPNE